MAGYRKLGRTSSQRKALLRNQVTDLLCYGKIKTTEAKAKEIRKIAEGLIALGVKEKDNFDEVTVQAKVVRKDANGKRVKEDGKVVFDTVEKTIKKRQTIPVYMLESRWQRFFTQEKTSLQLLLREKPIQKKSIFRISYLVN